MKVVIFTEDSSVKLPPINRWTGKYGRGIDITEDPKIIALLKNHNLAVSHVCSVKQPSPPLTVPV